MTGQAKIARSHLDRVAVIYVRQSSLAQVREHTESTARQYGLAEVALGLGWARADVLVIDTDLAGDIGRAVLTNLHPPRRPRAEGMAGGHPGAPGLAASGT